MNSSILAIFVNICQLVKLQIQLIVSINLMLKKISILEFHRSECVTARQFEVAFIAIHKITLGFIRHNQKVVFAGFRFLFGANLNL